MILNQIQTKKVLYDSSLEKYVLERFCTKQADVNTDGSTFFSQYWQGFAWAAVLGFINNRRIELETPTKSSFDMGVVARQGRLIFKTLILMAISKSENGIDIVKDPSKIVMILSEYAKGGAEYIEEIRSTPGKENFFNTPSDFTEEIMQR